MARSLLIRRPLNLPRQREIVDRIAHVLCRLGDAGSGPRPRDEFLPDAIRLHELLRSGAGDEVVAGYLGRIAPGHGGPIPPPDSALSMARELRAIYRSGEPPISSRDLLHSPGDDPFAPAPIRSLYNVSWGLGWGLWFSVWFSLLAVLSTVLTGGEIIERQGVSLLASIGLYVFGGIAGGITLGLLRPLTRTRVGSALVGVLVMIPMGVATGWALFGPAAEWDRVEAVVVASMPVLYGVFGGWLYWEPPARGLASGDTRT